jgi:hypothetical protein
MFHDVAYFETLGKVWPPITVWPGIANSLGIEQGTHINQPKQAGFEPQ